MKKNRHFIIPPCIRRPRLGGFRRNSGTPFVWKTRMVSLPDGEKISKICLLVLTWSTNVTDGRTDRQTDRRTLHDSKDRACIASRGKNHPILMKFCTHQHILNWINVTWSKMKKLHWTDSEFDRTYFLFRAVVTQRKPTRNSPVDEVGKRYEDIPITPWTMPWSPDALLQSTCYFLSEGLEYK